MRRLASSLQVWAALADARSPPRGAAANLLRLQQAENLSREPCRSPARLFSWSRWNSTPCHAYDGRAMIDVTPDLSIPEGELTFTASRSSGPGGQNVNKVATKVTLTFDVASSSSLSVEQRAQILARLVTRISGNGVLRVVAQRHRTQRANREAALERFVELLRAALGATAPRVRTRPSAATKQRRVAEKKLRGIAKVARRRPKLED